MSKKRVSGRVPQVPSRRPSFNYDDPDFLARVSDLAYEGFYDTEIADLLKVCRSEFSKAKDNEKKQLGKILKEARARAKSDGADIPSPALFAKVWKECKGKRSALMKAFGIGWTKYQQWLAAEPAFIDIMAERDLEFLEQADIAGRILTLGGVVGKDEFPGWERRPDPWMMRFYMNTVGRKYGYGENPILPANEEVDIPDKVERGIDIESWIRKEIEVEQASEESTPEDDT